MGVYQVECSFATCQQSILNMGILRFCHAACETGFADQAYLCRWFSRQFGFSARTLRSAAEALRGDDLKPALIGPSFARQ